MVCLNVLGNLGSNKLLLFLILQMRYIKVLAYQQLSQSHIALKWRSHGEIAFPIFIVYSLFIS